MANKIITNSMKALIENEVLAFATVDQKQVPNVIAVACCKVLEGSKILITDNFLNKTRKNLLYNNEVAIALWSKDEKEGYQFKGSAEYLTEGKYKDMVDNDPDNKGLAHRAAVVVTVEKIWDLVNPKRLV
jgi:hypothetical protein